MIPIVYMKRACRAKNTSLILTVVSPTVVTRSRDDRLEIMGTVVGNTAALQHVSEELILTDRCRFLFRFESCVAE